MRAPAMLMEVNKSIKKSPASTSEESVSHQRLRVDFVGDTCEGFVQGRAVVGASTELRGTTSQASSPKASRKLPGSLRQKWPYSATFRGGQATLPAKGGLCGHEQTKEVQEGATELQEQKKTWSAEAEEPLLATRALARRR